MAFKIGQPRFLTRDEVLELHSYSLDVYGGAAGFLNEGAFDSALAQPSQGFAGQYAHDFPFGMAAAYGFHLAMNHAFRDGNKRVAFAAMEAFLHLNGWTLTLEDPQPALLMLQMIEERRDKAWLAERLREACRERPSFELRDFFGSLSTEQMGQLHESVSRSNDSEFLATFGEAEAVVPIIPALKLQAIQASGEAQALPPGPDRDARELETVGAVARAMLLVLLYRIAEDMGYEW